MSLTSKILQVVIIGGASTHSKDGRLPKSDEIRNAFEYVGEYGFKLQILVVDTNLNYAIRLARGEKSLNTKPIVSDAQMLTQSKDILTANDIPAWEIPVDIRTSTENVIYISYNGLCSAYEIMSILGSYVRENRWFLPVANDAEPISIHQLMVDFINLQSGKTDTLVYLLPNFIYELYEGKRFGTNVYLEGDMVDAKIQLILGCEIMRQYITAGYVETSNQAFVSGWCLNPETPIIKGIISTYGLIPSVEDRSPHMEIRTNASYRQQLVELLARVISNFAINNGIITLEEAKNSGEWYGIGTYTLIISKLADDVFMSHVTPRKFNKPTTYLGYPALLGSY